METVRIHVYFSGRIQGVGFRYRAMQLAQTRGLTGWISNLRDGRVEMELQGTERDIYDMLPALGAGCFIRIDDTVIADIPTKKDEHSFKIL